MISIKDKKNCSGCSACASICPNQCITMTEDNEGFLYPKVNEDICINCGLCEKVCNELHPYEKSEPIHVFAAINKDEDIRLRSSSGGIFYLLAEKIIRESGVVFGARFDENWQVYIDYAEDLDGVEAFLGSKYVQARIGDAYKEVKHFLTQGRKVLFSGTPCQVAGLHKFLRKSYENLLSVDFVCHGTPSPKVWRMYLDEVVNEIRNIRSIGFRTKEKGWKNFCFNLRYNQSERTISMLSPHLDNPFMKAFLHDIILRPSCYECKAKGCSSKSDITLADFWGINTVFPELDDNKGTSLIFVNSIVGVKIFANLDIESKETNYAKIKPLNPACYKSSTKHPKRDEFFEKLDNYNLIQLIDDCTKGSIKQQLKRIVKRIVINVENAMGGVNCKNPQESTSINNVLSQESRIIYVNFRNKETGWMKYRFEIKVK